MNSLSPFIRRSVIALAFLSTTIPSRANPEIGAAIAKEFGEATARNIVLVRAAANESDPVQWTVYSRDPHHEGRFVRSIVTSANGQWTAAAAGGDTGLKRAPSRLLDVRKVGWNSRLAREAVAKASDLAKVSFAKVEYQLAANEDTGAPEWGLALQDATGYEAGFCIVSAETGAIRYQNWTPKEVAGAPRPSTPESEGERAAKKVKAEVRKAWNWTEHAGRQTGSFFRELFRKD